MGRDSEPLANFSLAVPSPRYRHGAVHSSLPDCPFVSTESLDDVAQGLKEKKKRAFVVSNIDSRCRRQHAQTAVDERMW